jgi:hypothetical protein
MLVIVESKIYAVLLVCLLLYLLACRLFRSQPGTTYAFLDLRRLCCALKNQLYVENSLNVAIHDLFTGRLTSQTWIGKSAPLLPYPGFRAPLATLVNGAFSSLIWARYAGLVGAYAALRNHRGNRRLLILGLEWWVWCLPLLLDSVVDHELVHCLQEVKWRFLTLEKQKRLKRRQWLFAEFEAHWFGSRLLASLVTFPLLLPLVLLVCSIV